MTQQPNEETPSFNLWTEPWITLEKSDGALESRGIRDALRHAHEYVAIYDPSPLVVVGIHRLLTAILQDVLNPQENDDLEQLWAHGKFPEDKIETFGKQYADRFDLFSEDKPFLQSADLPLCPQTEEQQKGTTRVARLFPEIPSGSLVTHYRHGTEDALLFSPAETAKGLVAIPPFATSGARGGGGGYLLPSINGVPPIYVLPGGRTLFEMLAASLISVTMLDEYKSVDRDVWWKRAVPVIVRETKKAGKGEHRQLDAVSYLHGLTFPARKVRLHPERLNAICSRSGQFSEWCVRLMTFRMGESLGEGAVWRDPFAAYRLPESSDQRKTARSKKAPDKEKPIRPPQSGKVVWREFTGLFLQREQEKKTKRPLFLDQFSVLSVGKRTISYPFRCVGWQTDGKMKFYEWFDFGFDVPPALLQDPDGAQWTDQALAFADSCASTITSVFTRVFGKRTKNAERFKRLKERMESDYWSRLAGMFRQFVLDLGDSATRQQTLNGWLDTVVREAQAAFDHAADSTGDDGSTLLRIEQGKNDCHKWLNIARSKIQQGG
jgi:CRISPR system Cascade subunit CasA